jgi:cytochrome P450
MRCSSSDLARGSQWRSAPSSAVNATNCFVHWSFSKSCLGAPLARLEGRIALQTVFERWLAIHQAGELVYADNFNIRIRRSLPVATS